MSHERKLKSYAAEAAFYSHYCSRVLTSGGAAIVAEALLVDVSPPTHFLFVLKDLRVRYPKSKSCLDKQVGGWAGYVTAVPKSVHCDARRINSGSHMQHYSPGRLATQQLQQRTDLPRHLQLHRASVGALRACLLGFS